MSTDAGISAIIHELSRQHACGGHVDIALAQRLAGELSGADGDIDVGTLRHLVILQSHLLSDLKSVLGNASGSGRLDEALAIQSAVRACLG